MRPAPKSITVQPDSEAEPAWREFARAPLVPIALSVTIGLLVDRYLEVPFTSSLLLGVVALVLGWVGYRRSAKSQIVWLWIAVSGLGAAHHHSYRHFYAPNDIAHFATESPMVTRVRGILADEPSRFPAPRPNPLVSEPKPRTTTATLDILAIQSSDQWIAASGRARLSVEGWLEDLHAGDHVEVTGRLTKPAPPGNPGEWDYRSFLLDSRITAELRVKHSSDPITRLDEGWRNSLLGWFGVGRSWGTRTLQHALPRTESGLAAALLLGDTAALDRSEWQAYIRTGVLHVLAISGQHLAILASFIWVLLKLVGVRRRPGAWIVAGIMLGYTLLTGARPSTVRAAVMVCAVCLAIVLRRPVWPANLLALAWLVIVVIRPTDPFTLGCQLSFLSVFVLIWGAARWFAPRPLTPIEQLIAETRTLPSMLLQKAARVLKVSFAISLILAIVNAPLILSTQNLVTPVGILLTPPLVLLTSIALLCGFLLLLLAPIHLVLTWPLARITEWCLVGCEWFVHGAESIPGAWVYSPAPSSVWLIGFYLGVVAVVLLAPPWPKRLTVALIIWLLFGLLLSVRTRTTDELRVTFLAVGHGCCVVMEAPDGRVILYDAGSTTGPETVSRVIAPYLWQRGIVRIDELFLSHADIDHFNGLPELLKRFPIGRITHTPSFPDKSAPGVELVLATIERYGVARRVASCGDRFEAGHLTLEVLHPPQDGPPGIENVRSMVLLVRFGTHTVLLTGDLEGEGQRIVQQIPIEPVEVMLAPHHGGKSANTPLPGPGRSRLPGLMAAWAKPKLVISSQRSGTTDHLWDSYGSIGARVWDTPTTGAVILRYHSGAVIAEAFRTGERLVVTRGRSGS
jgi:competence protein ComEC